jgi:hypothetical protein
MGGRRMGLERKETISFCNGWHWNSTSRSNLRVLELKRSTSELHYSSKVGGAPYELRCLARKLIGVGGV